MAKSLIDLKRGEEFNLIDLKRGRKLLSTENKDKGTGQNLSGTRARTIDRGAKTFFEKKNRGTLFFEKK